MPAREDPDLALGFALNLSTAVPEDRPEVIAALGNALLLAFGLGGQLYVAETERTGCSTESTEEEMFVNAGTSGPAVIAAIPEVARAD